MKTYKSPMFEFLEFEFGEVVLASGDLIDDVFGTKDSGDESIW